MGRSELGSEFVVERDGDGGESESNILHGRDIIRAPSGLRREQ